MACNEDSEEDDGDRAKHGHGKYYLQNLLPKRATSYLIHKRSQVRG